jgi:hypothetical protein
MSTAPDTTRCRGGHVSGHPAHHPRWGQVPSASSAVIGLIVAGAVLTVCWIWLPGLVLPLVLLLVAGLAASAAAQAFLGHRGACWGQRTIRWWLGPVGTLLDPFDLG